MACHEPSENHHRFNLPSGVNGRHVRSAIVTNPSACSNQRLRDGSRPRWMKFYLMTKISRRTISPNIKIPLRKIYEAFCSKRNDAFRINSSLTERVRLYSPIGGAKPAVTCERGAPSGHAARWSPRAPHVDIRSARSGHPRQQPDLASLCVKGVIPGPNSLRHCQAESA